MNTNLEKVRQTVSMSLESESDISREQIEERIRAISSALNLPLTEDEVSLLTKRLEASIQFTMGLGSTLKDSTHQPWLNAQREHIDWFYWNRYKQLLIKNNFGETVVGKMDIVTDDVLDLLQNPNDEGAWQRKGLVVGHVQSGKTANYTGVVCKALDAGYKVVIILAGLINSLRKQTQQRVDSGVIGVDSSLMLENMHLSEKIIGVGKFNFNGQNFPVSLTTAHADFNKVNATQRQEALDQYNQPIVFILKKNGTILRNVIDWLKNNNLNLSDYPLLLIDDEADHASINTNKPDLDPTTTNARIRDLLDLFPKNVYLGYTATPFANIFINPETVDDMMKDLFPENFIKTLDAPTNYFGGSRIFVEDSFNAVREIDDYDTFLPLSHKKDEPPTFLSDSLCEAVRVFILIRTARILRGQEFKHNSMLVNVSRFTGIQSELRVMIHGYLTELRDAIFNNYALAIDEALKNSYMKEFFDTWNSEFSAIEFGWGEIQSTLKKSVSPINVIEVNSSKSAEKEIDYSERSYPEGRHLIAVGGLSLSRGITLEGLSTTYFLRNSIMYDTLMQMGRWFGYRPGYEDLCRIYMTEQARSWYEYISLATDELRDEFKKMDDLNRTPKDFGLCVRNHPDSLIVTARNKMRSARPVYREIDLTGRLIETSRLYTDPKIVKKNMLLSVDLLHKVKTNGSRTEAQGSGKTVWTKVSYEIISDFVEAYQNHPESMFTDSAPVKSSILSLATDKGITEWNVVFVNITNSPLSPKINVWPDLEEMGPGVRDTTSLCTAGIIFSRRKVGSEGADRLDLKSGEKREVPLLMLHLLDCRLDKKKGIPVFPDGVIAYGISFPGAKNGRRINVTSSYQANKVWYKENYGNDFEDDEDMRGEYE
tara:strand:+ start:1419 stop:4058 length:2640 start_codon:yes stop_codon:yes gene_type:complete